jgi:CMP-N,N'-diacetyllegionaminic acid synthase
MISQIRSVALIPARSGSKRIPNKNVLTVNGHPVMAYAISSAVGSRMFDRVVVSTDSEYYAEIAEYYGADVPFLRPGDKSRDESPDVDWVAHALQEFAKSGHEYDVFAILRPTSPLRTSATIRRAFSEFLSDNSYHSLRAVERCSQHPGKMWRICGESLVPILPVQPSGTEWFSSPTQTLPEVWVQNASLEIAYSWCVTELHSITGNQIRAFKTESFEGFDLNSNRDLVQLRELVRLKPWLLPEVTQPPFRTEFSEP